MGQAGICCQGVRCRSPGSLHGSGRRTSHRTPLWLWSAALALQSPTTLKHPGQPAFPFTKIPAYNSLLLMQSGLQIPWLFTHLFQICNLILVGEFTVQMQFDLSKSMASFFSNLSSNYPLRSFLIIEFIYAFPYSLSKHFLTILKSSFKAVDRFLETVT